MVLCRVSSGVGLPKLISFSLETKACCVTHSDLTFTVERTLAAVVGSSTQ